MSGQVHGFDVEALNEAERILERAYPDYEALNEVWARHPREASYAALRSLRDVDEWAFSTLAEFAAALLHRGGQLDEGGRGSR